MDSAQRLERALSRFRSASREMRLQLLLAYARRFPELPPELAAARDAGLNRVEECQTPLFLWVGVKEGRLQIHADAPREAPTVRGFVGFLVEVLDGEPPSVAEALPADLLEEMGLAEVLGVVRARGLGAVIRRVKGAALGAAGRDGGNGAGAGGPPREGQGRLAVLLVSAGLALSGAACHPGPGVSPDFRAPPPVSAAPSGPLDPLEAAAIFDTAWTRIRDGYYDTTFGGRSWDGVRDSLRPRAMAARDEAELRSVIQEMLDGMGESHFALIPRDAADAMDPARWSDDRAGSGPPGWSGMELRMVEGSPLVVRVEKGSPSAASGISTGWELEEVDGRSLAGPMAVLDRLPGEAERRAALNRLDLLLSTVLRGSPGSELTLTLRDGEGRRQRRIVTLVEPPGEVIRMGNLPALVARLESRRVDGAGGECVGVIRLWVWLAPLAAAFDRAVEELRDCRGMVVDLRGNPGGVGGMVMGVAGHFVDEVIPLGTMTSRDNEIRFVTNPRRVDSRGRPVQVFDGPLAVLVDRMSASTSEIFAAGLQGIGRARIFGDRTPGQALPSVLVRLPNQDVLQYAIANFTAPDGSRIEGRGVLPDEETPLTRRALLEGRDPPLEAALRWIGERSVH